MRGAATTARTLPAPPEAGRIRAGGTTLGADRMEEVGITRREALGWAATAAAALTLPLPEIAAAARRRSPRPSIHCLGQSDRWAPFAVLGDCADAAFSPDGALVACTTAGGVEVRGVDGTGARVVTPPGYSVGGAPWHPRGDVLLVTGGGGESAADAPFAARLDGSGLTRLATGLPGPVRAACLSPDGRRATLTYLDGFVQRMLIADWQDGPDPRLDGIRALLPFDPRTEESTPRMLHGLSWYETRGFTPDGRALVFVSDRGGGMANSNVYTLDLESGRIRHVTRDDGSVEGAAVDSGGVLLYGSTRAREPAFLTLVTSPQVPPFLGFAATPALREGLSHGQAPIGNGDVIAADARTGLRARLVVSRETLARAAALGGPAADQRVRVSGLSVSGRELAVSVSSGGRSAVVLLRRAQAPAPATPVETPVPPSAAPFGVERRQGIVLLPEPPQPIVRTLRSPLGGSVELSFEGTLATGAFRAVFDGFVDESVAGYAGPVSFVPDAGRFRHEADVRRVRGSDAGEDSAASRGFYRAGLTVGPPGASGSMEGRSARNSGLRAVARDGVLVPEGDWVAGRGSAAGIAGAERCRKPRRRRRKRRRRAR